MLDNRPDILPTLSTFRYSQKELSAVLIKKYGSPENDCMLREKLRLLEYAFGSLTSLKGLQILDIGCGCTFGSGEANDNPGVYEPWLCRAVAELGAVATGIDIGWVRKIDHENFTFLRENLLTSTVLSKFPDHSFDAINCSHFFSSHELAYVLTNGERSIRIALKDRVRKEVDRLLKPNGIIIRFDTDVDDC